MKPWLVLLAAPLDDAGVEVLRIAVGALAAGAPVRVVASSDVRAAIDAGDVPPAADDYVRALRDAAQWEPAEHIRWGARLRAAHFVLRHVGPERGGAPLCVLDEDALDAPDEVLATQMLEAGQVVRIPS